MSDSKTHLNCKHFSYIECPHLNDEIMERATIDIPKSHGGSQQKGQPFPLHEEIDAICEKCDTFTQV